MMKYRNLFLCVYALCSIMLCAKPSDTHYTTLDGKSGVTLFNALSECANKGYHSLGYDGLYTAYPKTDSRDGRIWDMYSNCDFSYSNKCGNYQSECDCYNREHSVPKSWWGGTTSNQGCDIFILVPTDGKVNGMRNNYPFGEVSTPTYTSANGSKRGPSAIPGYSDVVFEPIDEYKGDFARGILGAMVKWKGKWTQDKGSSTFNGNYTAAGNYGLTAYGITLLMKWHRQDPVSQKELDRNDGIEQTQGNRNPFIDYPCLAEYFWGEKKDETVDLDLLMSAYDPAWEASDKSGCACMQVTSPTITTPKANTEIDFGNVALQSDASKFFTLKGLLLTQSLTLSVAGDDAAAFRVSPSSVSAQQALNGCEIAIIYRPEAVGTHTAQLSIESSECSPVTLALSGYGYDATQGGVAQGDYIKLLSTPSDWEGTYLIVYESESVCLDGSKDADGLGRTPNTMSVSISNNTITAGDAVDAASVSIIAQSGGYAIRTASGYYLGSTKTKGNLTANATVIDPQTLAIAQGNATITAKNGTLLRYNTSAHCFRYYSSGQEAVTLYRKETKIHTDDSTAEQAPLATIQSINSSLVVTAQQPVRLTIFDMLGRTIAQRTDVTDCRITLPQGIYLVQINDKAERIMIH
ncbi:MAG: endonuclease [Paludibacter sp.]|nr:endonuclease [Bacteroidales bacterium]MCM1069537.1 endonuclease [Prevotella sp.]MCM1354183.1 endonuclease [Bacteroides sp.]MCM1443078.1 endonuclease [Muribaculum sp.]MCM1482257.1 endonuclease [Paludibacter sp.]